MESGVWSMDPGRGQLLAVKIQPEGTGVKNSTTGKVGEEVQDSIEVRHLC